MISIIAMAALALVLIAYSFTVGRKARLDIGGLNGSQNPGLIALVRPLLYVPLLVIAARFGARTFPGIWTPHHPFLNDLTQGGLFYATAAGALLCGLIDAVLTLPPDAFRRCAGAWLVWIRRGLLIAVVAVCLYGFIWALNLQRLP